MPNIIQLEVENPDAILNAGAYGSGAIVRLQWSATAAGTFADVSGSGSTPTSAIIAGTGLYTAYDPLGTVSTWYRTRYENVGATRLSDWSASFQTGDADAGLLCSVYDVLRELGDTATPPSSDTEAILDKIRQVTTTIQGYTGRNFVRSPLSGTTTFQLDVEYYGRVLEVPVGISSATLLEIASITQPDAGGTYTAVASTDWFLRPTIADRDFGWPATRIELSNVSGSIFYPGYNTVRLTGALGWDAVPPDIEGIAIRAAVRRYIGKSAGGVSIAVGPSGSEILLPDMSGADRTILDWYRSRPG